MKTGHIIALAVVGIAFQWWVFRKLDKLFPNV